MMLHLPTLTAALAVHGPQPAARSPQPALSTHTHTHTHIHTPTNTHTHMHSHQDARKNHALRSALAARILGGAFIILPLFPPLALQISEQEDRIKKTENVSAKGSGSFEYTMSRGRHMPTAQHEGARAFSSMLPSPSQLAERSGAVSVSETLRSLLLTRAAQSIAQKLQDLERRTGKAAPAAADNSGGLRRLYQKLDESLFGVRNDMNKVRVVCGCVQICLRCAREPPFVASLIVSFGSKRPHPVPSQCSYAALRREEACVGTHVRACWHPCGGWGAGCAL